MQGSSKQNFIGQATENQLLKLNILTGTMSCMFVVRMHTFHTEH